MLSLARDLLPTKSHFPTVSIYLLLISSFVCFVYLFVSVILVDTSKFSDVNLSSGTVHAPTNLGHIVFGIASNKNSWPKRKDYVKLWWKPEKMRGCVFLESLPEDVKSYDNNSISLPPLCISEDTSRFRYTYRNGLRSAIRVARVVSETVGLNHSNVRWFVFGDDDTVFFPENLVKTLSKYDHGLWYYIGSNSEIYEQNRAFGFEMAFGGGGFAISYPLAKVLAKVFDSCIERYPHLYGSDSRVSSCLAELGVGLTREPGFHQRVLQKTVCYDRWFFWTISVSWGYAVEVYGKHMLLPDTLPVQATFKQWQKGTLLAGAYTFNVRQPHHDPCQRPTIFFLDHLSSSSDGVIISHYKKSYANCSYDMSSPRKLEEIKVFSHKLELSDKQLQAPRRQCCDVLPSSAGKVMEIAIRECQEEELIHMHA
ncbi:hypothetical protein MANES_13G074000v8 [Manihot esculenta]|uniref:Uncharacterized protein n=1 Tax=Manihot esculenta TaxID=3983 RepID=A0ACB7GPN9_MANES|nr:hypothetical protein MANES_13G074000v8 [Manihot esculenta]